jgi:hypothetical protein
MTMGLNGVATTLLLPLMVQLAATSSLGHRPGGECSDASWLT